MELKPIYDSRKSFYHKAEYFESIDKIELYSYGHLVLVLNTKENTVYVDNLATTSQTTLRHVREFIKQFIYNCNVKKSLLDKLTNKTISEVEFIKLIGE